MITLKNIRINDQLRDVLVNFAYTYTTAGTGARHRRDTQCELTVMDNHTGVGRV